MSLIVVFIFSLVLGVGAGQYYLKNDDPQPPSVLAEQIEVPTETPTPTLESTPTETPEPTVTATPEPTSEPTIISSTPTVKPTIKPTLRPTIKITVIATPTATLIPTNTPSSTPTPAPMPTLATITLPASKAWMEQFFVESSNRYHVDINLLKKIADCESHYNPGVVSRNELYSGMYQFSASTWIANRDRMGKDHNPDLRFGAQESIDTAAYVISTQGPGAWPACSR